MYVALPQRSRLQRKSPLRTESVLGMLREGRKETERQTLSLLQRALQGPGWAHNLIRSAGPWCGAGWAVAGPHCALLLPFTPHPGFVLSPTLGRHKTASFYQVPELGVWGGGGRGETTLGRSPFSSR